MTLAAFNGGFFWPGDLTTEVDATSPVNTAGILNGSSTAIAFIFQAPAAGNIDKLIAYCGNFTSAASIDCRLETVDSATGAPTGTLVSANTNGTASVSGTGVFGATLTSSATVVEGTFYAAVFAWISGSMKVQCLAYSPKTFPRLRNSCYGRYNSGAGYTTNILGASTDSYGPCFGARYDNPVYKYIPGNYGASVFTQSQFNNTSTTRERGMAFVLPYPAQVTGWYFGGSNQVSAFNVVLAQTNGTALLTASYTKFETVTSYSGANYGAFTGGKFPGTTNLTASTTYYLTLVPTSASNVAIQEVTILDASTTGTIEILNGGADLILVTRNSGGTYTTDNTKRPWAMGIIVSAFDDATGGGGGPVGQQCGM